MSSKPQYTPSEIQYRESLLSRCFALCDFNNDGYIDTRELEFVAKCFNPNSNNIEQEVKIIFGKLDKNQDSQIDLREWVSVLFDCFRFMNQTAFEKHCEELIHTMKKYKDNGSTQQSPKSNNGQFRLI